MKTVIDLITPPSSPTLPSSSINLITPPSSPTHSSSKIADKSNDASVTMSLDTFEDILFDPFGNSDSNKFKELEKIINESDQYTDFVSFLSGTGTISDIDMVGKDCTVKTDSSLSGPISEHTFTPPKSSIHGHAWAQGWCTWKRHSDDRAEQRYSKSYDSSEQDYSQELPLANSPGQQIPEHTFSNANVDENKASNVRCRWCSKMYGSYDNLRKHCRKLHAEDLLLADFLGESVSTSGLKYSPKGSSKRQKNYQCDKTEQSLENSECGNSFAQNSDKFSISTHSIEESIISVREVVSKDQSKTTSDANPNSQTILESVDQVYTSRKSERQSSQPNKLDWENDNSKSYDTSLLYDFEAAIKESLKVSHKPIFINSKSLPKESKQDKPKQDKQNSLHKNTVSRVMDHCISFKILQKDISSKIGVTQAQFSNWKNGHMDHMNTSKFDSTVNRYLDEYAANHNEEFAESRFLQEDFAESRLLQVTARKRKIKKIIRASEQPTSYHDDAADDEDQCSICYSRLQTYDHGSMNCCKQSIHRHCLQSWLNVCKAAPSCPLCRKKLNAISASRVFSSV